MHWYRMNLGTNFPVLSERTTSAFVNVLRDTNSLILLWLYNIISLKNVFSCQII